MPISQDEKGYVFNIQRYSVHDGPGIRTTVFLKGCPLRCPWCSNPESQRIEPELAYFAGNCIGCFKCVKACPKSALSPRREGSEGEGFVIIDRDLCDDCGACAQVCRNNALCMYGTLLSVKEVIEEVLKDKVFYRRSGGGLTLSGGEPTLQADFAISLLSHAKSLGVSTAIETSGMASPKQFMSICDLVDVVLYDVKIADSNVHQKVIGASNAVILQNLQEVIKLGRDVRVRIPIIPGYTDFEENVRAIASFVSDLQHMHSRPIQVDLIPYHRLGEHKYRALGRCYKLEGVPPLERGQLENLKKIVSAYGLVTQIGG